MNIQELFEEWKKVFIESISYQRLGIDGYMTEKQSDRASYLYNRKTEIEKTLLSMGYEIVDGKESYRWELKIIE